MARVDLEMEGLDEIKSAINELYDQIKVLSEMADNLSQKHIALCVKIGQPPAGTDC